MKIAVVSAVLGVVACVAATWSFSSPLTRASVWDVIDDVTKHDDPCTCLKDGEWATTEQVEAGDIDNFPDGADCGHRDFCVLQGYGQCRYKGRNNNYLVNGLYKKGEYYKDCLTECKENIGLVTRNGDPLDCGGIEVRHPTPSELKKGKTEADTSCEFYERGNLPTRTQHQKSTPWRCWIEIGGRPGGAGCRCSAEQKCQRYCWVGWGTCVGKAMEKDVVSAATQNQCGQMCIDDADCKGYEFYHEKITDNCKFYAQLEGEDDNLASANPIVVEAIHWAECQRKLTPIELEKWEAR